MTLRSYLTDPPAESSTGSRFAMLVILGAFLGLGIHSAATAPPDYTGDPYAYLVLGLTMLIQHIAFRYHFPPRITLILRLLALACLLFMILYITWLRNALHIRR